MDFPKSRHILCTHRPSLSIIETRCVNNVIKFQHIEFDGECISIISLNRPGTKQFIYPVVSHDIICGNVNRLTFLAGWQDLLKTTRFVSFPYFFRLEIFNVLLIRKVKRREFLTAAC